MANETVAETTPLAGGEATIPTGPSFPTLPADAAAGPDIVLDLPAQTPEVVDRNWLGSWKISVQARDSVAHVAGVCPLHIAGYRVAR